MVSLLVVLKKALLHSLGFHADDRLVCELVSEEVILIRVDKPTHAVSEQTPIDHRIDGLSFGLQPFRVNIEILRLLAFLDFCPCSLVIESYRFNRLEVLVTVLSKNVSNKQNLRTQIDFLVVV